MTHKDELANFNEMHRDVIKELFQIGSGLAANALNQMLNARVSLSIPNIELVRASKIAHGIPLKESQWSVVEMGFSGNFSGTSFLVFGKTSSLNLVRVLMNQSGMSPQDAKFLLSDTLLEVGNVLLNNVLGSLGQNLHLHLNYTVPEFREIRGDSFEIVPVQFRSDQYVALIVNMVFNVENQQVHGVMLISLLIKQLGNFIAAVDQNLKLAS